MNTVNILQNSEIAPGVFLLTFPRFFDFIPGQVIKITSGRLLEPRMYSIASGIHDEYIQILYDIKPEGELTNRLKLLKSNDELYISLPFGEFRCEQEDAWWIATGTGIAPFYSVMRSGKPAGIRLIHGVRRPEFLFFKDELRENFAENYVPCCSGLKQDGLFHGRVTGYIEQLSHLPLNIRYYLCGSAEMVVDVRDILISKGVDYGNIFSEIYF